jgi:hypothetical protein
MVNQKPISLKIDYSLLEDLDKEVMCGYQKRNGHINEAIRFYLDYKYARRRIKMYGSIEDKKSELQYFVKKWFPETNYW